MLVLIGYLTTIFSVFGGFALAGGHLFALFQPIELLMIGGAALGAFIVSNSWKIIKATMKDLFYTIVSFGYSKKYFIQLLSLLYEISVKVKKDGVMSIEADMETPKDSPIISKYPLITKDKVLMEFLSDYIRIIATGRIDAHLLETLMEQDIETFEAEKEQSIGAINKLSDGMPAFGIVAAVMGVVHTMESLGLPPEQLGGLIAKALVGTFLGVLLGYGFIAPLAVLLEHKMNAGVKSLHSTRVILIAMVNNISPSIGVEFGRKIIYGNDRPNGRQLEDILKELKQTKETSANEP
jgi:chemotaxis protein MotA